MSCYSRFHEWKQATHLRKQNKTKTNKQINKKQPNKQTKKHTNNPTNKQTRFELWIWAYCMINWRNESQTAGQSSLVEIVTLELQYAIFFRLFTQEFHKIICLRRTAPLTKNKHVLCSIPKLSTP